MYFPYLKGRYEVAPGLMPLSKDFGNGDWDQRVFQIGDDFKLFQEQMLLNRTREGAGKYACLSPRAEAKALGAIAKWMADRLAHEYSGHVKAEAQNDRIHFESKFTGDRFHFSPATNEVQCSDGEMNFSSAWDAMASQVPEDLAVWKLNSDDSEELEALHLHAPNHWAAESKIGLSFAAVHQPVAHIEKIVPWAVSLLKGIIEKGPYVRFAWGVGTDCRLNHHPEAAPGFSTEEWMGRKFNSSSPELYVRVERQVLWGIPELGRALFTIRTYFQDVREIESLKPGSLKGLSDAIESMSPDSLKYKGLDSDKPAILKWLNELSNERP